jgi:hypothetical protein
VGTSVATDIARCHGCREFCGIGILHLFQNTKNCGDIFKDYTQSVEAIHVAAPNWTVTSNSKFKVPPFVLDKERFVRGVRFQQRIEEVAEEKRNLLMFSSSKRTSSSYAEVYRIYQDEYIATSAADAVKKSACKEEETKATTITTTTNKAGPLRIVHVWSPYVVNVTTNATSSLFAPLNQAQNITWASLYRAQDFAKRHLDETYLTVRIYCAILWFDVDILQSHEPPLCRPDNTIVLKRSTATEFVRVTPKVHYPIVQDLLDPFVKNSDTNNNDIIDDFDYLILTNSDISLVEPFYILVGTAIRVDGHDAFTVNRRAISKQNNATLTPWTSNNIPHLESTELLNYKPHPGTDCFVMRSDVL